MKFQHFIISRFNLSLYDCMSEQVAEVWMYYRMSLFDTFCYPSIVNQENQNFIWLVFLSDKTPEHYRQLFSKHNRMIPIYCKEQGFDDIQIKGFVNKHIKQFVDSDAEYLITSRVDIDDMISKDYVQSVQTEMPMTDNTNLVFSLGYVLDLPSKTLMERKYVYNQFPSYIEKNTDNFKTVWFAGHHQIHLTTETKIIEQGRKWCWILHAKNKHPGSILKNYRSSVADIECLQNQFSYRKDNLWAFS